MAIPGGRYDFDDGGAFCGGWEDGKAHGPGVCTGPKGMGEFSGNWAYGFEASGIYLWPSGNMYEGQWMQGKRHGTGIEKKDKWVYKGEWTQGFKGRYGVRSSVTSGAKYEGTWTTGLQDGYGSETYADGGTYQGQWLRGLRHGFGVRSSVPYGCAAQYHHKAPLTTSMGSIRSSAEDDDSSSGTMSRQTRNRNNKMDKTRGGFVLAGRVDADTGKKVSPSLFDKSKSLKRSLIKTLKKQRSAGDISERGDRHNMSTRSTRSVTSQRSSASVESAISTLSRATDCSDHSFYSQDDITDVNVIETYRGEWKGDKRSGFGICERSDGLRYEGEWHNNKKYGYGVTTLKDGVKEEGKYKNNVLVTSGRRNKLFVLQKTKLRERIDEAVSSAQRAGQLAIQKADIAVSRMANAKAKAEQAAVSADQAQRDSDHARLTAKYLDPTFKQPGTHLMKKLHDENDNQASENYSTIANSGGIRSRAHSKSLIVRSPPHHSGSESIGRDYSSNRQAATLGRFPEKSQPEESSHKLSELMNPSTISDHFDHYTSPKPSQKPDINHNTSSQLSSSTMPRISGHLGTFQPKGNSKRTNSFLPSEPRLSPSVANEVRTSGAAPVPKPMAAKPADSLPVKSRAVPLGNGGVQSPGSSRTPATPAGPSRTPATPAGSSRTPATPAFEPQSADDTSLLGKTSQRKSDPKLVRSAGKQRGSMPDITNIQELAVMSKEELMHLNAQRRDDIRKLLDEEERRKAGDLSVLVSDVKKWVQQRQLMMLVVALNVSLASVIYNLMT